MNLGTSAARRVSELMVLRRDALLSLARMQFGLLLQIMQCEQLSADKDMFPIGQTSLHIPHLSHFSSIILECGLISSSRMHVFRSSISIALCGQDLEHIRHSIIVKY